MYDRKTKEGTDQILGRISDRTGQDEGCVTKILGDREHERSKGGDEWPGW